MNPVGSACPKTSFSAVVEGEILRNTVTPHRFRRSAFSAKRGLSCISFASRRSSCLRRWRRRRGGGGPDDNRHRSMRGAPAETGLEVDQSSLDSPLEESGLKPLVPLLRKGLPSVAEGSSQNDRLRPVLSSSFLARRQWLGALSMVVPFTCDRDFESRLLQRGVRSELDPRSGRKTTRMVAEQGAFLDGYDDS